MSYRAVLLVVCLMAVAMLSVGAGAQETTDSGTTDVALGTQLTSFTQSSSASTDDTVENGMWNARFNQSDGSQQDEIVRNRTGTLTERVRRLQNRTESVQAAYDNESISRQDYIARQSRLTAKTASLADAINDTETAAKRVGVNDSKLETLKETASTLRDQQVGPVPQTVGSRPPTSGDSPSQSRTGDDDRPGEIGGSDGEKQTGPPAVPMEGILGDHSGPRILKPRETRTGPPENATDQSPPRNGSRVDGTPASGREMPGASGATPPRPEQNSTIERPEQSPDSSADGVTNDNGVAGGGNKDSGAAGGSDQNNNRQAGSGKQGGSDSETGDTTNPGAGQSGSNDTSGAGDDTGSEPPGNGPGGAENGNSPPGNSP
jgi:hypothetical protein